MKIRKKITVPIFVVLAIVVGLLVFSHGRLPADEKYQENTYDWENYRNEEYGFELKYPRNSEVKVGEKEIYINLPFEPGTLLSAKYLKITVREPIAPEKCANPAQTMINDTETVHIAGIDFKKESGSEGAAGSIYESVSYSTTDEGRCFGLSFILRHSNPGGFYPTPPPSFDREKETEIFEKIVSTFRLL